VTKKCLENGLDCGLERSSVSYVIEGVRSEKEMEMEKFEKFAEEYLKEKENKYEAAQEAYRLAKKFGKQKEIDMTRSLEKQCWSELSSVIVMVEMYKSAKAGN
jgi:hypothetical protein